MNDNTNPGQDDACTRLEQAAEILSGAREEDPAGRWALLLAKHIQTTLRPRPRPQEETSAPTEHFYLYTQPDGEQRVFQVARWSDGRLQHDLTYFVLDEAPAECRDRFAFEKLPEDLEEAGREITEEEMKRLTGYYRPGLEPIEEATCALLSELERVHRDDPYYDAAHSLCVVVDGFDAGEPPDLAVRRW